MNVARRADVSRALAHFAFPERLGAELHAAGRVGPHPVNPHSSGSRPQDRRTRDVADVIALLRLGYDRSRRATRRLTERPT
jgi:hypothetical protein